MKPPTFDLLRAADTAEAVEALHRRGDDAKILAGGQSLLPMLNLRLAAPSALIDITRCEDLHFVRLEGGALVVGAAATQMAVERRPSLHVEVPLLAQALPLISHQQIRSRGTICGSIAHADPAAELPLVLATLGGSVTLRSRRGRRSVAADDFFTGMLSTARKPDELVEEVRFPLANGRSGFAFTEFSLRHGDFAIVAVAAVRAPTALRLGIGGVGDRPVVKTLPALEGSALEDALNELAWSLDARDDPHMTARGRRHLVRRLGLHAARTATQRLGDPH